jgi:hypothetical protein
MIEKAYAASGFHKDKGEQEGYQPKYEDIASGQISEFMQLLMGGEREEHTIMTIYTAESATPALMLNYANQKVNVTQEESELAEKRVQSCLNSIFSGADALVPGYRELREESEVANRAMEEKYTIQTKEKADYYEEVLAVFGDKKIYEQFITKGKSLGIASATIMSDDVKYARLFTAIEKLMDKKRKHPHAVKNKDGTTGYTDALTSSELIGMYTAASMTLSKEEKQMLGSISADGEEIYVKMLKFLQESTEADKNYHSERFSGVYNKEAINYYVKMRRAVEEGKIVSCGTQEFSGKQGGGLNAENISAGLVESHAYTVMGVEHRKDENAYYIKVRNPWSSYTREYAKKKGKIEHSVSAFNTEGIFMIELNEFLRKFNTIEFNIFKQESDEAKKRRKEEEDREVEVEEKKMKKEN